MIHEIHEQLGGVAPDVVVVALGGGGLMCGVLRGMHQLGWTEVPVVAVETRGADSLAECVREKKWTEIDDITRCAYVGVVCVCACVCVYVCVCVHACVRACVCV